MSVTILQTEAKPNPEGYALNPKQMKALPLIVSGMSNKTVAEAVKVNVWTVSQWVNHSPEFKQAVRSELELVTDRARRLLAANAVQAAETLIATSKTGSGSANTTKASQLILDRVGISGPAEGGMAAAGLSPEVAALANLIHARRAAEALDKAEANEQ